MNSRARQLLPAVEQAKQRSDEALVQLAAQQNVLAKAEHQLAELRRYREEYAASGDGALNVATLLNRPQRGLRPIAEAVFAALLTAATLYTGFNEGPDNWQSLWTCAVYLLLALTLWQARGVQIPK